MPRLFADRDYCTDNSVVHSFEEIRKQTTRATTATEKLPARPFLFAVHHNIHHEQQQQQCHHGRLCPCQVHRFGIAPDGVARGDRGDRIGMRRRRESRIDGRLECVRKTPAAETPPSRERGLCGAAGGRIHPRPFRKGLHAGAIRSQEVKTKTHRARNSCITAARVRVPEKQQSRSFFVGNREKNNDGSAMHKKAPGPCLCLGNAVAFFCLQDRCRYCYLKQC